MPLVFRLLAAVAIGAVAAPSVACIRSFPFMQLQGESDQAYRLRNQAWGQATEEEDRRARQVQLYDEASRVSLARVMGSRRLPNQMNDGSFGGLEVTVQPLAAFKGIQANMRAVSLRDAGISSCGRYGGGSATAASVGDYVLLFEDVQTDGPTNHMGLLLSEIRHPDVLERFNKVVEQARAAPGQ